MNNFSFASYENIFSKALVLGYQVVTLREFFEKHFQADKPVLVNRIDVDVKFNRLPKILEIYRRLGVRGSFFLRVHAPTYNLFNIGNLHTMRALQAAGNEIGLHTELSDVKGFLGVDACEVLRREIDLLQTFLGSKIAGTASHGDMTPYNNLDFWKENKPADFALLYEAYDASLWKNCRYVSDSEWVRWKAYENGVLLQDDGRDPVEHMKDGVQTLLLLTHPESWYDHYIYEE